MVAVVLTGAGVGDDAAAPACEGGTDDWETAAGMDEPEGVLGDCAAAGKVANTALRNKPGSVAGGAGSDDAIDRIDRAARDKRRDGEDGKKGMGRVLGMRVDDPLSDRAARQWAARARARVAAAGKGW